MNSWHTVLSTAGITVIIVTFMPHLLRQAWKLLPGNLSSMAAMSSSSGRPLEEFSMAFVTAPNSEKAKEIAGGIVSNKLAACVNIIPGVTSVYEWEGKIENDSEVLMMIKTRSSRIEELTEFVKKNHPYDVCEVITTSIEGGNKEYIDWIGKVVPAVKNN